MYGKKSGTGNTTKKTDNKNTNKAVKVNKDDMNNFIEKEFAKLKMNKADPTIIKNKDILEDNMNTSTDTKSTNFMKDSFKSIQNLNKNKDNILSNKGEDKFKISQTKFDFKVDMKISEAKQIEEKNQLNVSIGDWKNKNDNKEAFKITKKFTESTDLGVNKLIINESLPNKNETKVNI
jgi:hypothetical protein